MIYVYVYKSSFIYNYGMYRWYKYRHVSMCVIGCYYHLVCYWVTIYCLWCASMLILYNYRHICVTVWCTILSLHSPYNITRHGFCLTMLCLSDNYVFWFFMLVTDLSLYLLVFVCVSYCAITVACLQFYLRWWQVIGCVDMPMSTWLMLWCPNNNKDSPVSCLSVLILLW